MFFKPGVYAVELPGLSQDQRGAADGDKYEEDEDGEEELGPEEAAEEDA
jgi:hypothetical protein